MAYVNRRFICAFAAACCGDPQFSGSYRGDPIFQHRGNLQPAGPGIEGVPNARVGMFYAPGLDVIDPAQMVEHLGASMAVTIPSSFVLNVFDPPAFEHMVKTAQGESAGYALGRIMVYTDDDQDGRYTPGETIIGGEQAKANLYVPETLPAERTPTSGALPAGFLKLTLPQACGFAPSPPTTPGDCGVPLGGRCRIDADCKGGLCLLQAKENWKAGYCVVPDPPTNGCIPGAAAYLRAIKGSPGPPNVKGFYLRPCMKNADCFRTGDPEDNFYYCDEGLHGCTPSPPYSASFPVGGMPPPLPTFCAAP